MIQIIDAGATYALPICNADGTPTEVVQQIAFCKGSLSDETQPRQEGVFQDDILGVFVTLFMGHLSNGYLPARFVKPETNKFLPTIKGVPNPPFQIAYTMKTHIIEDGKIRDGAGRQIWFYGDSDGISPKDLADVLIHYLKTVNVGALATRETSCAITKLEELSMMLANIGNRISSQMINSVRLFDKIIDAQNWLNKRRDERQANVVLGTYNAVKAQNKQE